jgi:hypothetical protein
MKPHCCHQQSIGLAEVSTSIAGLCTTLDHFLRKTATATPDSLFCLRVNIPDDIAKHKEVHKRQVKCIKLAEKSMKRVEHRIVALRIIVYYDGSPYPYTPCDITKIVMALAKRCPYARELDIWSRQCEVGPMAWDVVSTHMPHLCIARVPIGMLVRGNSTITTTTTTTTTTNTAVVGIHQGIKTIILYNVTSNDQLIVIPSMFPALRNMYIAVRDMLATQAICAFSDVLYETGKRLDVLAIDESIGTLDCQQLKHVCQQTHHLNVDSLRVSVKTGSIADIMKCASGVDDVQLHLASFSNRGYQTLAMPLSIPPTKMFRVIAYNGEQLAQAIFAIDLSPMANPLKMHIELQTHHHENIFATIVSLFSMLDERSRHRTGERVSITISQNAELPNKTRMCMPEPSEFKNIDTIYTSTPKSGHAPKGTTESDIVCEETISDGDIHPFSVWDIGYDPFDICKDILDWQ